MVPRPRAVRPAAAAAAVCGLVALAGCVATFRAGRLEAPGPPAAEPGASRPLVAELTFDVAAVYPRHGDDPAGFVRFPKLGAAPPGLERDVERAFLAGGVIARPLSPDDGRGRGRRHVAMTFYYVPRGGESAAGFYYRYLGFLTLALLPMKATTEYTLAAEVWKGDERLVEYRYREATDTWVQLFLIVTRPFLRAADVEREVVDLLLRHLLADLRRDGFVG